MSQQKVENTAADSHLTVEDLMNSESVVLRRLNEDFQNEDGLNMASHNSTTTGHNSSGVHTSHTSAIKENLLK